MIQNLLKIPETSPERIFTLRESAFACDLFITAIGHFDFFNWLAEKPADIDTICRSLNIKKRPADVMLTLFKAYGLVNRSNNQYSLSNTSKDYLTGESDFDLSSYVNSLINRPICEDMARVMRTGKPANWAASKTGQDWATSMADDSFAESFTAGMNSRGAYLASGLLKAIDLSGYHKILDIGGASGIYSSIILGKYPDIKAAIFEKSPVDKVAEYSVSKFNMNKKIDILAGDMFNNDLPPGYDVHLLSHVLHDWDINEVKTILKNSFRNLESGGMIIIHDAHINEAKTGPLSVAEYSVLLMFLSEGKCYSITEMRDILEEPGFRDIKYKPTILNRSIITATKL
jgi:predicted O-methyltransferase YrrM